MTDLQLSNFSRRIAELLLEQYPDWQIYMNENPSDPGALLVTVPSPVADRMLYISVDFDDEITVAFDWYHQHFGWWYASAEKMVEKAAQFIDRILNEEAVVGVKLEGETWKGSRLLSPEDIDQESIEEINYTVSWLGTYDHQFPKTY